MQIRSLQHSTGGTFIGHGVKVRTGLGGEQVSDRVVTGITHLGKRAQVKIGGVEDFHASGLGAQVFKVLADAQVSVDLINLAVDSILLVIDQAKVPWLRKPWPLWSWMCKSRRVLLRFLWWGRDARRSRSYGSGSKLLELGRHPHLPDE